MSREALAAESSALMRSYEASTRLWRSTELPLGLAEILEATLSLLGAEMGTVQLLNRVTRKLEIVADGGFGDDSCSSAGRSIDDASACGRSLDSGQRAIIEDVAQEAEYAPRDGWTSSPNGPWTSSNASAPTRRAGTPGR